MLRTRLWMGALLVLLTVGVLVLDQRLAPWYPFLYFLILTLALAACHELLTLLGPARRPWPWLCYLAVLLIVSANWPAHLWPRVARLAPDAWYWVIGAYTAVLLAAFLTAMATFRPEGESVGADNLTRLALAFLIVGYLGLFPSFLAQLRWPATVIAADANTQAVVALALAIFVPKCCDIGAYTTGRLIGRHRMTPVLSPNKTWEGFAGGMALAVAAAVGINALGPALPCVLAAVGFGLTVGAAGALGDLAESFLKRECRQKDASYVVPGFGGILDVVDSILFAAPVSYLWLAWGGAVRS